MKINSLIIGTIASAAVLLSACNENTKPAKAVQGTEQATKPVTGKPADRNGKGQLLDAAGHLITGCPGHKEMIGSPGDRCPKCKYMTMIPITWDVTGVDTVRVTSLADYNPPAGKLNKK